jgi:hypothetical protein
VETLDTLRGHDEKVRACARELFAHSRGLDAYDRDAFATGRSLIIAAAAVVVVLLLVLVIAALGGGRDDAGDDAGDRPGSEQLHGL